MVVLCVKGYGLLKYICGPLKNWLEEASFCGKDGVPFIHIPNHSGMGKCNTRRLNIAKVKRGEITNINIIYYPNFPIHLSLPFTNC